MVRDKCSEQAYGPTSKRTTHSQPMPPSRYSLFKHFAVKTHLLDLREVERVRNVRVRILERVNNTHSWHRNRRGRCEWCAGRVGQGSRAFCPPPRQIPLPRVLRGGYTPQLCPTVAHTGAQTPSSDSHPRLARRGTHDRALTASKFASCLQKGASSGGDRSDAARAVKTACQSVVRCPPNASASRRSCVVVAR